MTSQEIRDSKERFKGELLETDSDLSDLNSAEQDEISKIRAHFAVKRAPLATKRETIRIAIRALQNNCKYHRLESFYGTCPDCDLYVPDTRQDGLQAHP